MPENTIHSICFRENSTGTLTYTFKAEQGYLFVADPIVDSINGQEWDSSNPMVIIYDTDYAEFYGTGEGVHGTQSVTITLSYDIPDLDPYADNTNEIKILFQTKIMSSFCIPEIEYVVFNGTNGSPRIAGMTPYKNYAIPQNHVTYNDEAVYLFVGMYQTTYDYYVDQESDALTLYSQSPGISVSGTNTKNVFISNSYYSGNVDIYWGNVAITISADFNKATMLFANGTRSTENWFRYAPWCEPNYGGRRTHLTNKFYVAKTGPCEFVASSTAIWEPESVSSEGQEYDWSASNGYSFSKVHQGRAIYNSGGNTFHNRAFEPYGRLITRGDTWISLYSNWNRTSGTGGIETQYDSIGRISFDAGENWQIMLAESMGSTWISDIVHAGYDSTTQNHVWYALGHYNPYNTTSYLGQHYIFKSVDDGENWSLCVFDGPNQANDFTNLSHIKNSFENVMRGRIFASLKDDYIFIYLPYAYDRQLSNVGNNSFWVLFRGFLSEEGSGNGGEIRPVIVEQTSVNPVGTHYSFSYTGVQLMLDSMLNNQSVNFMVNDNGFCILTGGSKYAVSWNFGLNWIIDDIPTTSKLHSSGDTYIYPEKSPTPVFFTGKNMILTNQSINAGASASYSNNPLPITGSSERLTHGMMEIKTNNQEGWYTGVKPSGWGDYQTFGPTVGLTSQNFGTLHNWNNYNSHIAFGNKIFCVGRYNLTLDPSYGTFYWHTYDVLTGVETLGNSSNQTPVGFTPDIQNFMTHREYVHGNNLFARGSVNGPISNVDEDWKLYKSTDLGVNWTEVFAHPSPTANLYGWAMDVTGVDPNMLIYSSTNGYLYHSTDSGNTWSQVGNIGTSGVHNNMGNPCLKISDGYLWIMQGQTGSASWNGKKNWIMPTSAISDGLNWAAHEVPQSTLAWTSSSMRKFAAYHLKGIVQDGSFDWHYTTDRGQTFTPLTSITTTDSSFYAVAAIRSFGGVIINDYNGKFLLDTLTGIYLETSDFLTWIPLSFDSSDVQGDNAAHTTSTVVGLQDGNWYMILNDMSNPNNAGWPAAVDGYRITNLSNGITTSPPTMARIIDSWTITKDYDLVETTGMSIWNILKDYEQPDGIPRMYINRTYGIDVIPAPSAPTAINGSSVQLISTPQYNDTANLNYNTADGYINRLEIYSDKPFTVISVRTSGDLLRLDGVFDIMIYSICEPVVIETESGQIINYGINDQVLYSPQAHSYGMGFSYYSNSSFINPYVITTGSSNTLMKNMLNREDVPSKANNLIFNDQMTYVTDYAIPIPSSYNWRNSYYATLSNYNPPEYGTILIAFPPRGKKQVTVVGMKLYADSNGTAYPDGYYKAEDWMDVIGYYTSLSDPNDGYWPDIADNDYMQVKDGFVVEVGHSKNLPDYNDC